MRILVFLRLIVTLIMLVTIMTLIMLVMSVFVRIMPFTLTVPSFRTVIITMLSSTVRFEYRLGTRIEFGILKIMLVASPHSQEHTKDQRTRETEDNLSFHIVFSLPRFDQVASKTRIRFTPIFWPDPR